MLKNVSLSLSSRHKQRAQSLLTLQSVFYDFTSPQATISYIWCLYDNNLNSLTDNELIEGCLKGKRSAQDTLYQRYAGRLLTVCMRYTRNRMDAEDMLQEAFVRIFKKIGTVRREEQTALYPWMHRVTVNLTLNFLRDTKKFRFTEELNGYEAAIEDANEGTLESIFESVKPDEILEIIRNLPTGYRTVFNLYVFEGYAHQDIAEALDISVNTSKTQLMKARRMIVSCLQKKIEFEPQLKLVI